jgi:hypothetical protein
VILVSLLVASVGLPIAARGLAVDELPERTAKRSEAQARVAAAEAALRRIQQEMVESEADAEMTAARHEVARRLLDVYRFRLDYGGAADNDAAFLERVASSERTLRLAALTAERDELYRLRRANVIDDDAHRRLVREIDLVEASLSRPSAAH